MSRGLSDELIIFLSTTPWHSPMRGRHHLGLELAKKNDVLFVDPPPHLEETFKWRSSRRRSEIEQVGPRLNILRLSPCLGESYKPLLRRIQLRRRLTRIHKFIRTRYRRPPIVVACHPQVCPLAESIPAKLVCYYVYDNYSGFARGNEAVLNNQDRQLAQRADVVIAVSQPLKNKYLPLCDNCHAVHNGVNYALFADRSSCEPVDMRNIPRPRSGLIAATFGHIDFAAVRHLVDSTDLHVIVIGGLAKEKVPQDQQHHLGYLMRNARIHWLGHKSYQEIPDYVANIDVCLAPYLRTEVTSVAETPLKVLEYFAAGKPVVASGLPAAKDFTKLIHYADSTAEWPEQVCSAYRSDNQDLQDARRRLASENSWEVQAGKISTILAQALVESANDPHGLADSPGRTTV